jgi:hypothetical protein
MPTVYMQGQKKWHNPAIIILKHITHYKQHKRLYAIFIWLFSYFFILVNSEGYCSLPFHPCHRSGSLYTLHKKDRRKGERTGWPRAETGTIEQPHKYRPQ